MRLRYLYPLILICSLLVSCSDSNPLGDDAYVIPDDVYLNISPTSLSFDASASYRTISIDTNSGYSYSSDVSWLSITRSSDGKTLSVYASANTGTSSRYATITITAASSSRTVSVTQSGNSGAEIPSLSVSPTSLSFAAASSSQTLSVSSNGIYSYSSSASWLTVTQSSDKTTLTVSASANTGTSARTATITLTLGSLTETISVTQQAAANTSDDDRTFTVTGNGKTVTFTMKKVEGGTFQMGSTYGDSDETPVHSVTLTKDYYMCETEVTQALWFAVMGYSPTSGGSQWSSSYGLGDEYPAYRISYEDCQSFLTALNSKLSSQLGSGEQFRFPTEAEWEFAAKGGNKSQGYTYSGSNNLGDVAWYYDNSGSTTHQVKTKSPNELGLYDMSGNVWEWCYDWNDSYSSSAQTDPTGPTSGSYRVKRGGGWSSFGLVCRVAYRRGNSPSNRDDYLGFRLAL